MEEINASRTKIAITFYGNIEKETVHTSRKKVLKNVKEFLPNRI